MKLRHTRTINLLLGIAFFIFVALFAAFFYLDAQKETSPATIAIVAALTAVCTLCLFGMVQLRDTTQLQEGTLKRYGPKTGYNIASNLLIIIGCYHLLTLFLPANSPNPIIKGLLLGLIFIILGIQNRTRFYVEIKNNYIIKNKMEHFKIDSIESFCFTDDAIVLKNSKKTMELHLNELTSEEHALLRKDILHLEDIKYNNKT